MLRVQVTGMTCGHCVTAVTRAVGAVALVEGVDVDLGRGEVSVRGRAEEGAVRAAIVEEGYEVRAVAREVETG